MEKLIITELIVNHLLPSIVTAHLPTVVTAAKPNTYITVLDLTQSLRSRNLQITLDVIEVVFLSAYKHHHTQLSEKADDAAGEKGNATVALRHQIRHALAIDVALAKRYLSEAHTLQKFASTALLFGAYRAGNAYNLSRNIDIIFTSVFSNVQLLEMLVDKVVP
jgi:hypothetical protein